MQASLAPAGLLMVLAGCLGTGAALDTGDIAPGGSATLTFRKAGSYDMHCHPHPFMEHVVTVTEDGPAEAHVHIEDGNTTLEYRFVPDVVVVRPGGVVTYHNHGELPHTATIKGH
jgi:plastocyanin